MPPTAAALPQALQSITATKITELKKQRALFESRKSALLKKADSQTDLRERVRILLEGVTKIQGFPGDGLDTSDKDDAERDWHDSSCDGSTRSRYRNIRRFLFQSKYDSSISSGTLSTWEEELKRDLDLRSRKELKDSPSMLGGRRCMNSGRNGSRWCSIQLKLTLSLLNGTSSSFSLKPGYPSRLSRTCGVRLRPVQRRCLRIRKRSHLVPSNGSRVGSFRVIFSPPIRSSYSKGFSRMRMLLKRLRMY
ncbi:RT-like superfamily domain-containing protein [Histoplasma capsulatum]|uniref:RT-like superfamily domain-containing protein n=1 Tax=Ajellomyces capsulatus TaxID=5037 RepID=A0A8A1M4Y7_AJECA|nr:RT-like superfamily domain-containing protein [Histoplasma capsulatum]